ncbi:MAG: hypothetical protein ACM3X4_06450 [Ignavibacteriales bacterium]
MRIGTLLKGLRLAHYPGAPVRTFAHTVGIPERTVGAIEAGWRFPSLSTLTLYFQMQGPEGNEFRKAAQLASRIYREELVLRRLILDEPWFTASHILAKHVLRAVFERLPNEEDFRVARVGYAEPDCTEDSPFPGRPEECLVAALRLAAAEPACASGDMHGSPTRPSGRTPAFCALFLRYLLTEIRFFAEADIKYEQIDSPFSEKQIDTTWAKNLSDLPGILDLGMVPNAFSVLDLLILGVCSHVDFDLTIPGIISVVVPFDNAGTAKSTEARFSTRVSTAGGPIVQPFARTPWRPKSDSFVVDVVADDQGVC